MRLLLAVLLALAIASTPLPAIDASLAPPPDDTGNFVGTWYYADPAFQIAIFVSRDAAGALHLKYHLRTKGGAEYETDAGGFVKLMDEGNPTTVLFTGTLAAPNRIKGYHERTVRTKTGTVQEAGDFELYVAEKGRKLVLHYPLLKRSKTDPDGRTSTEVQEDVYRLFRKASEMVVDFSEIPF
jgi:hypothetical protein